MGKLDELIKNTCPNGVPYVKIGNLCTVVTKQTGFDYSNTIKKSLVAEPSADSVPYIQTKFFSGKYFDYNTDYYVPQAIVERYPKITLDQKCLLFSIVGASIGNVGLFPGDRVCFLGGAICVAKLKPEYNAEYIYYCVESHDFQKQIAQKMKGCQATITVEDVREFSIPFPPIEIQEEIVRILDEYSEKNAQLIDALKAELEARKVQFEYYRNQLFINHMHSDTRTLSLGTISKNVCSGGTPKKAHADYYEGGNIPWLRTQEVKFNEIYETEELITEKGLRNSSAKWIPQNCVIVAISGATAGRCAINKIALTTNQHCCNFEIDPDKANYEYVYYWVSAQYQKLKALGRGARDDLNAEIIKSFPIPVPSLEVQLEIVSKLNEYNRTQVEIEAVIENEIRLRQTQYEYYRDKLLTFREAN